MVRKLSAWLATLLMLAMIPALVIVMATATFAAKPASSVWLVYPDASRGIAYGDAFSVGYATPQREPWALTQCYPDVTTQLSSAPYGDGTIWSEYFSVYPGGPVPQAFVLGDSVSPIWTGGGATCTITLLKFSGDYSRETVLATSQFSVQP